MLERHRIPLLRHDAAHLHEPVRQPQVANLDRRPEQQILREAAEADDEHGGRADGLEQVVDGADAAVGVAGRSRKAEQLARPIAIDRKAGARDRARAERIAIHRRVGGRKPRRVPLELSTTASR